MHSRCACRGCRALEPCFSDGSAQRACSPEQDDARSTSDTELFFKEGQLQHFEGLQANMRSYALWSFFSALLAVGRIVKDVTMDGWHTVRFRQCTSMLELPCAHGAASCQ